MTARSIVELVNETITRIYSKDYQRILEATRPTPQIIKIQLPRAMGHTTAAATLLAQYPSMLILPTTNILNIWKRTYYDLYKSMKDQNRVLVLDCHNTHITGAINEQLAGKVKDVELLILDNAEMYKEEDQQRIVSYLAAYTKVILMLG